MERGGSEEVKAGRGDRLLWVACLLPGAMVISGPRLLPRAMSGSVVLLQPWSGSMSVAPVTMEGRVVWGIWTTTWGSVGV